MSTYGEIIANVMLITPRPELETLVRSKINQIINYISKSGSFWRDIEETTIGSADGVDAAAYTQAIPVTTVVRHLKYVQYPDRTDKILCLNLEEIVTNWEIQNNIAYLAGSTLRIKHQYLASTFNIAYYTSPESFATNGDDDAESNWITELAPGLVEDLTAAYILNLKGDEKDSGKISDLAAVMKATHIRDFVNSII